MSTPFRANSSLIPSPMRGRKAKLERTRFVVKGRLARIRRDFRKRLGTAKPRKGSRRELEKKLESLNAQYVKPRDGYVCGQCEADGIVSDGILDAGHIYPKGKFPGGKFLVNNIVAQCRRHNKIHIARPEIMFTWYQKKHGPDALIRLHDEVLAMPRKMEIEWLREQIAMREIQIEELQLLAVA